ncbi:Clp protease N-terminal domain-containing protein [Mycobacterium sp. SMC-4]|uniref:Clp protease N-terminal domain-containing protein n=1 Tax=Mycobacterium sp. SMC-4 TaxID=2857059 RepID=UPI0021B3A748|nr:Clp protease N-terminal domain-containing protein [Mycobacterium sp. SMC-4]UXA18190.1 Clp protease [Mycobacterium sp. SMC-4]
MFERFGRHARVAVVLAQEEAKELGANVIEPQHLLAGVLRSASRQLSAELAALGLSADVVRDRLTAGTSEASFDDDADALRAIGIDLPAVRDRVNRTFGAGSFENALGGSGRRLRRGTLPFAKSTKKALELGLREALAHKTSVIESEHLLLGIVRAGDPVACGLITEHVTVDELRHSIDALLRGAA